MRWCAAEADGALDGKTTIRALRKAEPALGIVAHGERADRHLANTALQAGASAYVARTAGAEQLKRAVGAALAQESFVDPAVPPPGSRGKLTRRQREILQLIADGESTTVAAREARPQRRNDQDPHQERPRPPRRPQPDPRRRDRPARVADRINRHLLRFASGDGGNVARSAPLAENQIVMLAESATRPGRETVC